MIEAPRQLPMPPYRFQAIDTSGGAALARSDPFASEEGMRHFARKWWFGELADDPNPELIQQLIERGRSDGI